ncbi:Uncharacterized protein dnl_35900 [Desulfonema limicola]|uniref:Uncharacterized protein n=2 Tax=Desulfonema limicola TaxID=45656 RepID=A0A975B941_9BACT|nr:Uncharacterized protein dnl_35900 [Desulfonema limicola]
MKDSAIPVLFSNSCIVLHLTAWRRNLFRVSGFQDFGYFLSDPYKGRNTSSSQFSKVPAFTASLISSSLFFQSRMLKSITMGLYSPLQTQKPLLWGRFGCLKLQAYVL